MSNHIVLYFGFVQRRKIRKKSYSMYKKHVLRTKTYSLKKSYSTYKNIYYVEKENLKYVENLVVCIKINL